MRQRRRRRRIADLPKDMKGVKKCKPEDISDEHLKSDQKWCVYDFKGRLKARYPKKEWALQQKLFLVKNYKGEAERYARDVGSMESDIDLLHQQQRPHVQQIFEKLGPIYQNLEALVNQDGAVMDGEIHDSTVNGLDQIIRMLLEQEFVDNVEAMDSVFEELEEDQEAFQEEQRMSHGSSMRRRPPRRRRNLRRR